MFPNYVRFKKNLCQLIMQVVMSQEMPEEGNIKDISKYYWKTLLLYKNYHFALLGCLGSHL